MRALYLQIAIFGIGCVLILFSIWFSISVTFPPVRLTDGDGWTFGPRAAAHLIGFAGIVMAGWCFLHSFALMTSKALGCFVATLIVSMPVVIYLAIGMRGLIRPDVGKLLCVMILNALGACAMAVLLRLHFPKVFAPVPAMILAVVGAICMSLYWEGITQHLVNVYDGPPRGYTQLAQITCDIAGIAIGTLLVTCMLRQSRKHKLQASRF
ncbi:MULTISPECIES: hypothetical protein [Pseudomonas]|nr:MULTISPECIES: hypothetical protein [Pseudomonas]